MSMIATIVFITAVLAAHSVFVPLDEQAIHVPWTRPL